SGNLVIHKLLNGSTSTLGSTAFSFSTEVWYWLRLRCEGTDIKAKVWEDGDPEPGWMIEETDSDISSGYAGVENITSGMAYQFIGVGTGGSDDPDQDLTPAPARPGNVISTGTYASVG